MNRKALLLSNRRLFREIPFNKKGSGSNNRSLFLFHDQKLERLAVRRLINAISGEVCHIAAYKNYITNRQRRARCHSQLNDIGAGNVSKIVRTVNGEHNAACVSKRVIPYGFSRGDSEGFRKIQGVCP